MSTTRVSLPAGRTRHDRFVFRVVGESDPQWRRGRRHDVARFLWDRLWATGSCSVRPPVATIEVGFAEVGNREIAWCAWVEDGLHSVGRVVPVVLGGGRR